MVTLHRYRFDAADFLHSRGSWWPDDVRSFVQTIVTQLLQSESCLIARKIGACHHDVSAKFYLFLCIVGWCNLFTPQIIFAVLTQRFFANAAQSVRKLSCTENSVTLWCVVWLDRYWHDERVTAVWFMVVSTVALTLCDNAGSKIASRTCCSTVSVLHLQEFEWVSVSKARWSGPSTRWCNPWSHRLRRCMPNDISCTIWVW